MKGYIVALIEILLFTIGSITLRNIYPKLKNINTIIYFWVMLTILTGLWEISFIYNYKEVTYLANDLITTNTHTWNNNYNISYLLPCEFSKIFYAEYGAWADREYMSHTDDWSRVIESSHCGGCALFSLLAILFKISGYHNNYLITLSVSMGTQFMNSLLYMCAYFIQERDPSNINYNSTDFPSNACLSDRPFMWVNILWLVMPFSTIFYYIIENSKIIKMDKVPDYWDNDKITKM
jgi:hypothetical protein